MDLHLRFCNLCAEKMSNNECEIAGTHLKLLGLDPYPNWIPVWNCTWPFECTTLK